MYLEEITGSGLKGEKQVENRIEPQGGTNTTHALFVQPRMSTHLNPHGLTNSEINGELRFWREEVERKSSECSFVSFFSSNLI